MTSYKITLLFFLFNEKIYTDISSLFIYCVQDEISFINFLYFIIALYRLVDCNIILDIIK